MQPATLIGLQSLHLDYTSFKSKITKSSVLILRRTTEYIAANNGKKRNTSLGGCGRNLSWIAWIVIRTWRDVNCRQGSLQK